MVEKNDGLPAIESNSSDETQGEHRSPFREGELYEIKIKGHLDSQWLEWSDGLTVTKIENGETTLNGPVGDQTSLYRLLAKVRRLDLKLLSLKQIQKRFEK